MKNLTLVSIIIIAACFKCNIDKKNSSKEDVLRITYDAAYYLGNDESVISKSKNNSNGNSYVLSVPGFRIFRISSYSEENQLYFSYLVNMELSNVQYIQMPDNSSAYYIGEKYESGFYNRWAWTFHGSGIVFEAISDVNASREKFLSRIKSGLKVFF